MAARICSTYLGDNDGTCPVLHCIRIDGHDGDHDNVHGDCLLPVGHALADLAAARARIAYLEAWQVWARDINSWACSSCQPHVGAMVCYGTSTWLCGDCAATLQNITAEFQRGVELGVGHDRLGHAIEFHVGSSGIG